jgi:hypothetical protein
MSSGVRRLVEFLIAENTWAIAVRATTLFGILTGVCQLVDRYFPKALPNGGWGFVMFALLWLVLVLGVELMVLHRHCTRVVLEPVGPPEATFARSLVMYAESLASARPPRDLALLELRRWSSRLLHLNGSHKERSAIGELALSAAASLGDTFTQAAILVDDVGWGLHVQGQGMEAKQNIQEGLRLLESTPVSEGLADTALDLKLKGKRHLAAIEFHQAGNLNSARAAIDQLRNEARALSEPSRGLHLAQLDHTEGILILRHLESRLGPSGVVDPTGELSAMHDAAIALCSSAEQVFAHLGDVERQVKTLRVRVDLLRHGRHASRLSVAEGQLRRLQAIASRRLSS